MGDRFRDLALVLGPPPHPETSFDSSARSLEPPLTPWDPDHRKSPVRGAAPSDIRLSFVCDAHATLPCWAGPAAEVEVIHFTLTTITNHSNKNNMHDAIE